MQETESDKTVSANNGILCPNCGAANRSGARFCVACGRQLLAAPTISLAPTAQPTIVLAPAALAADALQSPDLATLGSATLNLNSSGSEAPLPEGALVADRYRIGPRLDAPSGAFAYRAEDTGAAPYGPDCIIKESADTALVAPELAVRAVVGRGDGLRPPYDAFALVPGDGAPRTFVVLAGGRPFDELPWPVEVSSALEQGAALARGVAAVHAAGLAFGPLDDRRVFGDERGLYLADFAGCCPGSPAAYARDVRALAALAHRMLTGGNDLSTNAPAPLGRLARIAHGQVSVSAAALAEFLSAELARIGRPQSFDLRAARRSDVGRLRELNEDSLLALELITGNNSISRSLGLYVIADGMGGHEGGEVASGLLVQAIAREAAGLLAAVAAETAVDAGAWLDAAIQAANAAVFERAHATGVDMGTTVVAALVAGNEVTIAHVGDSRAYCVRPATIELLTTDHSLVESMIASNQITREEARHHPQANVIYRTIGDKLPVAVDLQHTTLGDRDHLLLCSDGLNGMVSDKVIEQLVLAADSPQAACDALVNAANEAGGEDNITVIVIRVEPLD